MILQFFSRGYRAAVTARLNGTQPDTVVPDGGQTQRLFMMGMFGLMGRLAKLDGRVTESEVRYASTIMALLSLDRESKQEAIHCFELGKSAEAEVLDTIKLMAKAIGKRSALAHLFLKVQCRATMAKGDMRLQEKVLLRDVADELGYEKWEFLAICDEMQRAAELAQDTGQVKEKTFLQNAYQILQLKPDVADSEIKRAYLRLMSRYHPDKLVRDNLPEEALKTAQEKSMAIRTAYETVCGFRNLRA